MFTHSEKGYRKELELGNDLSITQDRQYNSSSGENKEL
jgi:hypothetical protein